MYKNKFVKISKNCFPRTNNRQKLISLFQNPKFRLAFIVSLVLIIFPVDKVADKLNDLANKYLYPYN